LVNNTRSLFLTSKRQPRKLWTDQNTEFTNNPFKKFLKDNNIELYHVYNEGKAAVVERFNRTLGEMIQKHLTSRDSTHIDVLQRLLDEYNNTYHSSIKMTPFEASQPENRDQVMNNEGKCKWSYGPSCPVDFPLNIHSFIIYIQI